MDYFAIRTLRKRCPTWQRILFLLRNLNAGREWPVLIGAHHVQYWHGENLHVFLNVSMTRDESAADLELI